VALEVRSVVFTNLESAFSALIPALVEPERVTSGNDLLLEGLVVVQRADALPVDHHLEATPAELRKIRPYVAVEGELPSFRTPFSEGQPS
jgi:hypothetical protein